MLVTFVVETTDEKSGTGRLFVSLARELEKDGNSVQFATKHVSDMSFNQVDISVHEKKLGKIFGIYKTILHIRRLAKKSDVLVAVDVRPMGILCLFATIGLNTPLIVHAVGTYSLFTKNFIRDFFVALVFKYADEVFVLNEFTKKSIILSHKSDTYKFRSNYTVAPVGVDVDLFAPRDASSHLVTTPYIVSVGPLKQRKGYHLSIPAFIEIAKEYPNLTYCIVTSSQTEGAYTRFIASLIEKSEVADRIVFCTGTSDIELQKIYSHAEFHLLTSITTPEAIEAFGMVYAEAALCGITSIGCKGTGAEIAIDDEETGLLAEQNSTDIARCMRKLLDDPELNTSLGKNAQVLAKRLTWTDAAKPYILVLEKIMNLE